MSETSKKLINAPTADDDGVWTVFGFASLERAKEVEERVSNMLEGGRNVLEVLHEIQDELSVNELMGVAFMLGEVIGSSLREKQ